MSYSVRRKMEVSGRKDSSLGDSSKQSLPFCQPCENDGQHSEAEGFCQNCKEYLCFKCITYHRKVTLSKNHVILDKRNMPAHAQRQALSPVCTELCEKHTTEVVKFFCKQHDKVGCGDCMILEHKACKVDYIPDISEAFLTGTEFTTLQKEIRRLQSVTKSTRDVNGKKERESTQACTETVNAIRTFRKDINDYLDRMEKQLLERCDSIKKENITVIQKVSDDLQRIGMELDLIHAQLTSKTEQSANMFVKAKKASVTLQQLQRQMAILVVDGKSKIKVCQFKRSQNIDDVISRDSPLGEIELRSTAVLTRGTEDIIQLKPETEGFIDVKTTSDKSDCYISSIVLLNDTKLVCTDFYNNKVKLIDTTQGTLISEKAVEPDPWDVALVPNEEIAVTLCSAQKIQVLSFRHSLQKGRFIKVNGKCRGIDYSKDRLFVSYEKNAKVEILTLQGNVLQCFETDGKGNPLFKWPLYVAVGRNEEIMYVSDKDANSVIKLTFDGQVLDTYSDQTLCDPRKPVVLGNDHILVPTVTESNVQLISPDGKILKKIFEKNDDIFCLALCYDEDAYKLYSGGVSNRIQIFKLK